MMSNPVNDTQQRKSAININQSYIVQAPAGSGKTELLIQRYLNALAHCQNCPEEVLAITFTKKAASEMRHRILQALKTAASNPQNLLPHQQLTFNLAQKVLTNDQKKQWNLLTNPSRLQIKTIDSLCKQITTMHGASLAHPHPTSTHIYQAVANTFMMDLLSEKQPDLIELLFHFNNDHNLVQKLLSEALSLRDQWLPLMGINDHQILIDSSQNYLRILCNDLINEFKNNLFKHECKPLVDSIGFALTQLGHTEYLEQLQQDNSNLEQTLNQCKTIAEILLTKSHDIRKSITKKQGFPAPSTIKDKDQKEHYKTAKQLMQQQLRQLEQNKPLLNSLIQINQAPSSIYPKKYLILIKNLNFLLPRLVAYLNIQFNQNKTTDFTSISLNALTILETEEYCPSDCLIEKNIRLRHLLIDEFQDTSQQQLQLINALVQNWDMSEHCSIFLVGDPMQSIYKFRQADVPLFYQVEKYGIGPLKCQSIQLSSNFRSNKDLVNWFNSSFPKIFPKQRNSNIGAVPYHPSHPIIEDDGQVMCWWFKHHQASLEVQVIIAECLKIIKHEPHAKIGILARSRTLIAPIIAELKNASIPFHGYGLDSLIQVHDATDLLLLTQFIEFPDDDLICATLLKSRLFGLTHQDIYLLKANHPNQSLWSTFSRHNISQVNKSIESKYSTHVQTLLNALKCKRQNSRRQVIFELWTTLSPISQYNNSAICPTIKFLDCLEQAESLNPEDPFEILFELLNQETLGATVENLVNIEVMTIHKSKGLEFDYVFIPGMGKTLPPRSQKILWWDHYHHTTENNQLLFLPSHQSNQDPSLLHQYIYSKENQKESQELIRLLYVAATRAMKKLYWSGVLNEQELPQARSPLSQLWQGLTEQEKTSYTTQYDENKNAPIQYLSNFKIINNHIDPDPDLYSMDQFNIEIHDDFEICYGLAIHHLMHCLITTKNSDPDYLCKRIIQYCIEQNFLPTTIDQINVMLQQHLNQILTHAKTIWLLDTTKDYKTEQSIYNKEYGKSIVDLVFLEKDIFWIIDYKTNALEYSCSSFDVSKLTHHQYYDQLTKYISIFKQTGQGNIKAALYYPISGTWHEMSEIKFEEKSC